MFCLTNRLKQIKVKFAANCFNIILLHIFTLCVNAHNQVLQLQTDMFTKNVSNVKRCKTVATKRLQASKKMDVNNAGFISRCSVSEHYSWHIPHYCCVCGSLQCLHMDIMISGNHAWPVLGGQKVDEKLIRTFCLFVLLNFISCTVRNSYFLLSQRYTDFPIYDAHLVKPNSA